MVQAAVAAPLRARTCGWGEDRGAGRGSRPLEFERRWQPFFFSGRAPAAGSGRTELTVKVSDACITRRMLPELRPGQGRNTSAGASSLPRAGGRELLSSSLPGKHGGTAGRDTVARFFLPCSPRNYGGSISRRLVDTRAAAGGPNAWGELCPG